MALEPNFGRGRGVLLRELRWEFLAEGIGEEYGGALYLADGQICHQVPIVNFELLRI